MSSTGRLFVGLAGASLLIATALGAYVSHGLEDVAAATLESVRTAVAYQFYHGLALLATPLLHERLGGRILPAAGWLFAVGTLLFCGGIYASSLLGLDAASRAAPAGGVAFIGGWAAVVAAVLAPGRPARAGRI